MPKNWSIDSKRTPNLDEYSKPGQGLKELKPLGFAKALKGLKGLHFLGSIGDGIKFEVLLPDALLGAVDGTVHLDDPDVQEILQRIDSHSPEDLAMAKRVVKLKRTQFHNAPYTELMMHDWFSQKGVDFAYQVPLNGGRTTKLGQVLDFAVFGGGYATAIPCQGDFWHSRPEVAASDVLDKASAMGQYINGFRVEKYAQVWESQLYRDRNTVLSLAIVGIELPRI
jgi:hypothetical protein